MRRRDFIIGITASAAMPVVGRAQKLGNARLVAVLMSYTNDEPEVQGWIATFHDALEKLGWVEGQNIKFEYRWSGTSSAELEQAAKELMALHPHVILAPSSPATAFALKQTSTIPVIFVNVVDPIGQGFVANLSRPGGNATGLINFESGIASKWMDLLKEIVPTLTRVGVPFNPVLFRERRGGSQRVQIDEPLRHGLGAFKIAQGLTKIPLGRWSDGLPLPSPSPPSGTEEERVTAIFLGAMGRILRHELAHLHLRHQELDTSDLMKEQEFEEGDRVADWRCETRSTASCRRQAERGRTAIGGSRDQDRRRTPLDIAFRGAQHRRKRRPSGSGCPLRQMPVAIRPSARQWCGRNPFGHGQGVARPGRHLDFEHRSGCCHRRRRSRRGAISASAAHECVNRVRLPSTG